MENSDKQPKQLPSWLMHLLLNAVVWVLCAIQLLLVKAVYGTIDGTLVFYFLLCLVFFGGSVFDLLYDFFARAQPVSPLETDKINPLTSTKN